MPDDVGKFAKFRTSIRQVIQTTDSLYNIIQIGQETPNQVMLGNHHLQDMVGWQPAFGIVTPLLRYSHQHKGRRQHIECRSLDAKI